jgi:hypothetical protein
MNRKRAHVDAVVLYRGGIATSGLLSASGNALRETRLTAMPGFLLARRSDTFYTNCSIFPVASGASVPLAVADRRLAAKV